MVRASLLGSFRQRCWRFPYRKDFELFLLTVTFKLGRMANTADSKRTVGAQEAIGETATQSVVVAVDRYSCPVDLKNTEKYWH